MSCATAEPVTNGREANGRFAKGNSGGPGNPFARSVAALRSAILERVTPAKMGELVDALLERAIKDDNVAAKLILQYAVGKPAGPQDPDRVDVDEMQKALETAPMLAQAVGIVAKPEASLPLDLVREARPGVTVALRRRMADALLHPEKYRPEQVDLEMVPDGSPTGLVVDDEPSMDGEIPRVSPSPNGHNGAAAPCDDPAWLAQLAGRRGLAHAR